MDTGTKKIEESGFRLKKVTDLIHHVNTKDGFISESDLAIQTGDWLLQYEYEKNERAPKTIIIKPGSYNLIKSIGGIDLTPMEFVEKEILTSITNTSIILNEAQIFFNNLHIYDELNQLKKRAVLLYGFPGNGKSLSIVQAARDLKTNDPNSVIINWPTSEIAPGDVFKFFTRYSEYSPECSKLILVIEDLGGSSHEGYSRRDEVSSSLLNLLDGINNVFKIPTLILSTTNHPENLMAALANRPGRFDMLLEIGCPKYDERIALVEFLAKRTLIDEEKEALNGNVNKGAENFSIAHLQEIVIRSRLHSKSVNTVVKELINHADKYKIDFNKTPPKKSGFSLDDLDD